MTTWEAPYAISYLLDGQPRRAQYESVLDAAEGFRDLVANPATSCLMMEHCGRPVFKEAVRQGGER